MAVAQLGTVCAPASSLTVWLAPGVKLGASLTAVDRDRRSVCVARLVHAAVGRAAVVVEPQRDRRGAEGVGRRRVGQRCRLALTAGPAENSAALVLLVTVKVSVWPDSSAGPALIAVAQPGTVCAPASSSTVWSAPLREARRVVDGGHRDRERLRRD